MINLRDKDLAPVVVFAYNRLNHLQKTIEALQKNPGIESTKLYVFSDGSKNSGDVSGVVEVRNYLTRDLDKKRFGEVNLVLREKNLGLAKSVISGVSEVLKHNKCVIVVEDDVVVKDSFIEFMNLALDIFSNEKTIFSIGGFHPLLVPNDEKYSILFSRRCCSSCWATWQDRWDMVDWEIKDYPKFKFNFYHRRSFNSYGKDLSSMLDDHINGRINSWAIRFDYNIWKKDKFVVLPVVSLCRNIGADGSGTHSSHNDRLLLESEILDNEEPNMDFNAIYVPKSITKAYREIYNVSMRNLTRRYLSNLLWEMKDKVKWIKKFF